MMDKFAEKVANLLFDRLEKYLDAKFQSQLIYIDNLEDTIIEVTKDFDIDKIQKLIEQQSRVIADQVAGRFRI